MRIRIDIEISDRVKRTLAALVLAASAGAVGTAHANWSADTS